MLGIVASLTFAELLGPLYRARRENGAPAPIARLCGYRNLQVVDLTPPIAAEAARLRATYGVRTQDAIHAATAIASAGSGIVSNDRGLHRLAPELTVWRFDEHG